MKNYLHIICLFFISIILVQCGNSTENDVTRSLRIIVMDTSNHRILDPSILIYNSVADWKLEINPLLYDSIDGILIENGIYYVDVQHKNFSNWGSDITMEFSGQDSIFLTVKPSPYFDIASAKGKTFQTTEVTPVSDIVSAITLPPCSNELEYTFFKNLAFEVKWGPSCSLDGIQYNEFNFTENSRAVFLSFENGDTVTYPILSHSKSHFILDMRSNFRVSFPVHVTYSLIQ